MSTVERRIVMGLGDAVLRLIHVEAMYANGVDPGEVLVNERNLIVEALNDQFRLDLGMDCDQDGIPDSIDDDVEINSVEIFNTAAETSCCRILPEGVKDKTRTVVASSRKKKAAPKGEAEKPSARPRKEAKSTSKAVAPPKAAKAPEKVEKPAKKAKRGSRKPSKDLAAGRKSKSWNPFSKE